MSIGDRIRKERMKLGLTQVELAKLIKTPPPQISRWEQGHVVPGLESIRNICSALAIDERDIIGDDSASVLAKYQSEPDSEVLRMILKELPHVSEAGLKKVLATVLQQLPTETPTES